MIFFALLVLITSAVVGVWLVGVFLIAAFHPRVKKAGVLNLVLGIPCLAVAANLAYVLVKGA